MVCGFWLVRVKIKMPTSVMIFIAYVYKYNPTYRVTLTANPTRETKHQIGMALATSLYLSNDAYIRSCVATAFSAAMAEFIETHRGGKATLYEKPENLARIKLGGLSETSADKKNWRILIWRMTKLGTPPRLALAHVLQLDAI